MDQPKSLLLEVWREVCQHTHIGEALERIGQVLAEHLPLQDLLLRRIDLQRCHLETVAHHARGQALDWPARSECRPEHMSELLAWCGRKEIQRCASRKAPDILRPAIPLPPRAEVIVAPLAGAEGPAGLVVFVSSAGRKFEDVHEQLVRQLLEPLSVALENDARVREMATLREAAEADKRSLLTRLGRQDISDIIIGADHGLRHVMERVALVAPSDAPVLLFGETGSGKEVIARAVHSRSPRAAYPFLRVNCGAIPQDLIDSELFGHEKGSFTGAVGMRKGWFERADGGTLFLDEIGELPAAAQVRLLRILQDGTFERIGGQRQLHVNVRIVAATHRNLQAMVADGRFREDLWYRVAVFPIYLPALRDRPEDIPDLAAHLALKSARRFGMPPLSPTAGDIHLLLSYSWPGNVRELGAVIDRAVILGNGARLEMATALGAAERPTPSPAAGPGGSAAAGAGGPAPQVVPSSAGARFPTLDEAMKQHIEQALAQAHGRIEGRSGAAAILGINPHTLRARMRKLKIDWAAFRARLA